MPTEDATAAAFVDAHEERITRLEDGLQEVATSLATNTERVVALGDKLDLTVELIGQKIEACINPLTASFAQHVHEDTNIRTAIDRKLEVLEESRTELAELKKIEDGRAERKKYAYKIIAPILTAGAGWLIHSLWHLLRQAQP